MAEVILKDVMKIYPNAPGEGKKKKKKGEEPEKKHNLQITERGVVAVQQFNLSNRGQGIHRPRRPLRLRASPPPCV